MAVIQAVETDHPGKFLNMQPLRLRPLITNDELEVRAAQAELAGSDGFDFAFHLDDETNWNLYIESLRKQSRGIDLGEGRVPATFLVAVLGEVIVGRSSIRHELNDFLLERGGHIGYAVRTPYRRQGIATEILRQSLVIVRSLGVDEVLVTCDDENVPSWKIIEHCGGTQDVPSYESDGTKVRRYWIR